MSRKQGFGIDIPNLRYKASVEIGDLMRRSRRYLPGMYAMWTALALSAYAQSPTPHPDVVVGEQQTLGGEMLRLTNGTLRIRPCEGEMVRVSFVRETAIPDLSNAAVSDA